jgi:hypothetical protein
MAKERAARNRACAGAALSPTPTQSRPALASAAAARYP